MSSARGRSACRCVAYDRRVEEPRYGASHLGQRLSLKVRTSILGAVSRMAAMPFVLPVPGLFSQVAACAGYAATRSEDLVDSLRIMVDAIGADGAPTDHPSGDGPLVCNVAGASQRHRDVRVEPHVNRSSKRGHVCA